MVDVAATVITDHGVGATGSVHDADGHPSTPAAISIDADHTDHTDRTGARHITFCVITFRRPHGLARALRSIAALDIPALESDRRSEVRHGTAAESRAGSTRPVVDVVVVDNDPDGGSRDVTESVAREVALDCRYVVEPARGITHARNRALLEVAASSADWLVWLDDDEALRPDWLRRVLSTQATSGADVVIGPSNPIFEPDAEQWIVDAGVFARQRFETGEHFPFFHARTSGVLIRAAAVPEEGFDNRLALSGGSDRVWFTLMHRAGARFVWDDGAIADEWVPSSRVSVGWILRRWFRIGVTRSLTLVYLDQPGLGRRVRRVLGGSFSALRSLPGVVVAVFRGRGVLLAKARPVLLGIGAAYGALGLHYAEYRKVHGT